MWVEMRRTSNLLLAEMWKELFEGEGISVRLLTEGTMEPGGVEDAPYVVYVPFWKKHVAEEVLRKI